MEQKVKDHPMCRKFTKDRDAYIVIFPEGDFTVNGVCGTAYREKGVTKIDVLNRILTVMEREWVGSYP
jgi:hypothetical protein